MDIYISNLPDNLEENHLRILFEPFGEVILTTIVKDSISGRSKGFGFVNMLNEADAHAAIEDMDGRELAGKTLIVMEAKKGFSKASPVFEKIDSELSKPQKFEPKRRTFDEDKWDSATNFDPDPCKNDKLDLEVKDEASFSKETVENGFVQIRFKR